MGEKVKNVAIQTIKALSKGPWGDKPKTHTTWYEPFSTQAEIDLAVQWVLSRPGAWWPGVPPDPTSVACTLPFFADWLGSPSLAVPRRCVIFRKTSCCPFCWTKRWSCSSNNDPSAPTATPAVAAVLCSGRP